MKRTIDNINFLLSNEQFGEPKKNPFFAFSYYDNFYKIIAYTNPFIILMSKIIKTPKGYVLFKDKKVYKFEALSSKNITKCDKNHIKKHDLDLEALINKSLRITCFKDLNNPHFIFAKNDHFYKALVSFFKNGKEYILDYENDLIMKKDDYYQIFDIKELAKLDKSQVYNVWITLCKTEYEIVPLFLILFYDEIFKSPNFSKKNKYTSFGMHRNNYSLIGEDCDSVFKIINEEEVSDDFMNIKSYTENPTLELKGLSNDNGIIKYHGYIFQLLSDIVVVDEIKEKLLSNNRYGHCHSDSISILHCLFNEDESRSTSLKIATGYLYCGDKDYIIHSWVELDQNNSTVCFDFSHNLIMRQKDYYKLMDAEVLSRVTYEDFDRLENFILDIEAYRFVRLIEVFGNEILTDLKKNPEIYEEIKKSRH